MGSSRLPSRHGPSASKLRLLQKQMRSVERSQGTITATRCTAVRLEASSLECAGDVLPSGGSKTRSKFGRHSSKPSRNVRAEQHESWLPKPGECTIGPNDTKSLPQDTT